jgi:hypothetical protein
VRDGGKIDDFPSVPEPTVRGLLRSLAHTFFNSLKQNKLASVLAVAVCLCTTYFAITIQYDERLRYRESILPEIQRAENEFFKCLEAAESAPTDLWRLQYFLIAHGKAKEVIRIARERQPVTLEGMRAHNELIRYYELVNENMAIIRTEMSINQDLNYMAEWKKDQRVLQHIRQGWLDWHER